MRYNTLAVCIGYINYIIFNNLVFFVCFLIKVIGKDLTIKVRLAFFRNATGRCMPLLQQTAHFPLKLDKIIVRCLPHRKKNRGRNLHCIVNIIQRPVQCMCNTKYLSLNIARYTTRILAMRITLIIIVYMDRYSTSIYEISYIVYNTKCG